MAAGRQVLQNGLHRWGCDDVDDAVLVFSELVTNAAVHTAAGSRTVVRYQPPNVRIEVHDTSHGIPQFRYDRRGDDRGFGLWIVSQPCDSWGWNQTATGNVVWSIVHCDHR